MSGHDQSLLLAAVCASLLVGCLEQTTGESRPLDERFIEQTGAGAAGALAVEGPTVKVVGTVTADSIEPIDVDITVPDADAAGGRLQLGKVKLEQPGAFEFEVPADKTGVSLAFFQDLAADGPSADDPYAEVELNVGTDDIAGLEVALAVGSFAPPTHAEAEPGAPGGGAGAELAAAAVEAPVVVPLDQRGVAGVQPFADIAGARVTLRGTVTSWLDAPVDLVASLDDGSSGTLLLAGPGAYELVVPRSSASVSLVALQDLAADGADAADPQVALQLEVGELDIDGVDLVIVGASGTAAAPAPAPAETQDPVAAATQAPTHDDAAAGAPEAVEHHEMPPGGELDPAAGLAGPFDDYEGPTVMVTGTVVANDPIAIDLDMRTPDAEEESGVRALGKVLLQGPGDFAVRVPAKLGDLRLEGFQDLDGDGPDGDDPWGAALVDIGSEDVAGVRLMLVAGGRGSGSAHAEVAHIEAAVGEAATVSLEDVDRPVDPSGVGPFANHRGVVVKVRGSVASEEPGPVDIDVWIEDADAPGGMRNQGKIVLVDPGDFVLRVPSGAGKIALEGYQDSDADGPTEVDPFGRVDLEVAKADVEGVELELIRTGARDTSSAGAAPPASASRVPFEGFEGPTVILSGVIRGDLSSTVFVDVRQPDADAPGGMRAVGQLHLEGPGVFELKVPQGVGALELEAFQDDDRNGPDDDDPYGRLALEVEDRDLQAAIDLVLGGRALAAAAGAPGGAPAGAAASPGEADAFPSYEGDRVEISGTITYDGDGMVDVDLFKIDSGAPGGRSIAGKLKVAPGAYSFTAPVDLGELELEAFVDVDGDGPSAGDPVGRYPGNPLTVGSEDVAAVDIEITGG